MNLDFWIFRNLEREFLKNESKFFWIFGDLEREFLKNESGIFWIFGNLEWKFFKNEFGRSSGDARGKKMRVHKFRTYRYFEIFIMSNIQCQKILICGMGKSSLE